MDQRVGFVELRLGMSDADAIAVKFEGRRMGWAGTRPQSTGNVLRVLAWHLRQAIRARRGLEGPRVNAIWQIHGRSHQMVQALRDRFRNARKL